MQSLLRLFLDLSTLRKGSLVLPAVVQDDFQKFAPTGAADQGARVAKTLGQ